MYNSNAELGSHVYTINSLFVLFCLIQTLKWNFASPRTEHIEQLKEQFAPCVSGTLRSQLFHSDFKFHLVALSTLTQVLYD